LKTFVCSMILLILRCFATLHVRCTREDFGPNRAKLDIDIRTDSSGVKRSASIPRNDDSVDTDSEAVETLRIILKYPT
jgi:hypothetical protein